MPVTQTPFPRTANATDARQAVTTAGRKATIDFVVIHKGDLLEAVTYADWGTPTTSGIQRLVQDADAATEDVR